MLKRVPLALHTAESRSPTLTVENVVNLYPEEAPKSAKSRVVLLNTPGQVEFSNLPSVRGLHKMDGVLYAVSDETLYSIDAAGASTSLGSIPGVEIVSIAENGTQLCIVTNPKAYIYTVANGLVEITDTDFPGASTVTYLDGYFVFTRPDTGQFFISAILDGTNYDALDFATAESSADDVLQVLADHSELWLIGEESIEAWYNSGAADFPFARPQSSRIERGGAGPRCATKLDNSVFWLGEDLVAYRASGITPERISTHAIEKIIGEVSSPQNVVTWTYTQEGHAFFVLTFPGEATLVYDANTRVWHQRKSYGEAHWKATTYVYCYGKHLVGGDKIYELSLNALEDDGSPIVAEITTVPYGDNTDRRHFMSRFQLDMETGVGTNTGQGTTPKAMLQFSDDGGHTWSNEIWRNIGKVGKYETRVVWNRLGSFRQRSIRIAISDPVKRSVFGGFAQVRNG